VTGAREIALTPDGAVWTIVAGKAIYRFDANLNIRRNRRCRSRKTGSRIASRLRRTTRFGPMGKTGCT